MADPAVPGLHLSRRERWAWRRRGRRAWRRGEAERDAAALALLRRDLTGQRLQVGVIDATVSELVFDGDERVKLGWCHRPTLRRLRDATVGGDVRLIRADHSGHVWALYVATRAGTVALLSTELRVHRGHGGTGRPGLIPGGHPPALVV